jgi:hypothetical protein
MYVAHANQLSLPIYPNSHTYLGFNSSPLKYNYFKLAQLCIILQN